MLLPIEVPEAIKTLPISFASAEFIDAAYERIEAFLLREERVIENFVNSDFHLVDQALSWIEAQHLLAGNRFCEFGSGFGVATCLAAMHGLDAYGIEIEMCLVDQATRLAAERQLRAEFYCGSFVPREAESLWRVASDITHVETDGGDVYEEIGRTFCEFDLCFAYPWPGEHQFFEAVFERAASTGALLLTYHGREGMRLSRKA